MSVGQVLLILWRRSWIVALTFLTAIIVAGAVLLVSPGRYDAIATASIDSGGIDPVGGSGGGSAAAIGMMQGNLTQLVASHRVALDVVKRLNLTANSQVQQQFRASPSFGRESIDDWMAESLSKNVAPGFAMGSNVLTIKYKSGDPDQAALIANAFMAAAVDATIAMRAASGEQTARWFDPQMDNLRKELGESRAALEKFQSETNFVAPQQGADTESTALMAISQELDGNRAALRSMQSRLASGDTNLASDPSDPDLQEVNSLKDKLIASQASVDAAKMSLGANNPKMLSEAAIITSLRKQVVDATARMRDHLKARIALTQDQIGKLEVSQADAQKTLIAAQAQRDRFGELARDVGFRAEQLNQEQKTAAMARLESKLTFAGIAVLDKAVPPLEPSFPKPTIVIPVSIAAGLSLGLLLALLAEMTDRRVRSPADLEFATSAPVLGFVRRHKVSASRHRLPRPGGGSISPFASSA